MIHDEKILTVDGPEDSRLIFLRLLNNADSRWKSKLLSQGNFQLPKLFCFIGFRRHSSITMKLYIVTSKTFEKLNSIEKYFI